MKPLILISGIILLSGCASNTGVVDMGQNTYMVSRQSGSVVKGVGTLKADAIGEARTFCGGRELNVLKEAESEPPYIFGNFPRVEIQFSCN